MSVCLDLLEAAGAVLRDDHFVYTSGRHGSVYINKDALYPHTAYASRVGELFAHRVEKEEIETVVAPALGGIILSQWTAHHLTALTGGEVVGVYAEKTEDGFAFTRGYDSLVKGKRVLVLEDLTTTGGSVKKVVEVVRHYRGEVVAVGVMVNRNPAKVNSQLMEAPFFSLAEMAVESFEADDCPLCEKAVPVNTLVGHGKTWHERML